MIKNHYLRQFLLPILLALLSQTVSAQDQLTMNMRDADIRALIQWVADNTGKNIIVHKDVEGLVTVLSPNPVTPEEAYQVFLSVLQVHGYAAIETPEALKIVPKSIAANSGVPGVGVYTDSDMVVAILKMENVSAERMNDVLRPLLSNNAAVSVFAETNSIVIADHANNIESARALINRLDQSGNTDIELIQLQHADAQDILQSLQSLLTDGNNGDRPSINLSIDERTNSILMAGDPNRRKQARNLIEQLDKPLTGQGNTQVVYLHYVDAKEIAPILTSLASSIQANEKDSSGNISIESSDSANALVINAPPALLSTMKRVISQLDIRRAQVLVEALVVEVRGDVTSDVGVTWITDPEKDFIGAVNTLGDLPLAVPNTGDGLPAFSAGRGFTFGYFNDGDLQAAIRALDATQNANILSTPTIVAIDNEAASLLVGQNVPFITGQSTGSSSSTNNPFTTIERQDIGISLEVTPRINQGDSITLEIKQTTENIDSSLEVASDIITNKREILTKALIKDGQILVLGGLISDEEREVKEKVPFLGDLPLVGRLFSSTGTNHNKINLMVFIHPVILKDEEHIRSITQKRYNFMKQLREEATNNLWQSDQANQLDDFSTFTPRKDSDIN